MGARLSFMAPRWKALAGRSAPRPSQAVQAAGPALEALHEALGRTPPACTDDARFTSDEPADVRHAVADCQPCPAREECLAYGRAIQARTGTWGGRHLGRAGARPDEATPTEAAS